MLIKILEIDFQKKKSIGKLGDEDVFGYWIRFSWESLNGFAHYFPYGVEGNIKVNKICSVETNQKQIKQLKILKNTDNLKPSIKKINDFADYIIIGTVEVIYKNDLDEAYCADIKIKDCYICVTSEDIILDDLKKGDFVEFILHGLELFDEGIY